MDGNSLLPPSYTMSITDDSVMRLTYPKHLSVICLRGLPWWPSRSPANAGDTGLISGRGSFHKLQSS